MHPDDVVAEVEEQEAVEAGVDVQLSTSPHEYLRANAPALYYAITESEEPTTVAYLVGITNDALQLVAQQANQQLAERQRQRQMEEMQRAQETQGQIAVVGGMPPVPMSRQMRRQLERNHR